MKNTTLINNKELLLRTVSLGVPFQDARQFVRLVTKWVEGSGYEWTIKRLKSIKIEFITSLDLDQDRVKAPWVARNRDGFPKGILSKFFTHPYYASNPQVVLNILMIYSTWVSSRVTLNQKGKFLSSALREDVSPSHSDVRTLRDNRLFIYFPRHVPLKLTSYPLRFRSDRKRVPYILGTEPENRSGADLRFAAESSTIRDLYDEYWDAMNASVPFNFLMDWRLTYDTHPFVGVISFIQEGGYKLRAVANPNRVIQNVLEPVKQVLREILMNVSEDCTFDQEKGVRWCKEQLMKGCELHSIDLSDATNLFPFWIQEIVLSQVKDLSIASEDKDLFQELCSIFARVAKSSWRMPDGSSVTFNKGQPLGLGPSFFLFALAHHSLLHGLDGRGKYVILGDDIVISDPDLARRYRAFLSRNGCDISQDKSIQSRQLAEFASRIITSHSVLRQWKWRSVSKSNVIDICRNMGPGTLKFVPKNMRRVVLALAAIPEQFGGLGWNPNGLSVEERMDSELGEYLISPKEEMRLLRKVSACCITDYVRDHRRLVSDTEEQQFVPVINVDRQDFWHPKLTGYWEERYNEDIQSLYDYHRPGGNLGEYISVPQGASMWTQGYIPWSYEHNPWQTDTSEMYRIVSQFLRSEHTKE